jgi:hypothetical protein
LCRNRCSRTFKTKFSRSPSYSSRIKKASLLEHVSPIGLELLSLACPGLDLGRVITLLLLSPLLLLWLFDPISMENRIWGDGNETGGVMPTAQGFVWCDAGSLRLVIIPKSKDWFMERPPMKAVQP